MQASAQMADSAAKLGKTPANGGPTSVLDQMAHTIGP